MSFDFPIVPPIRVKDTPHDRRLNTLADARAFVNDAFAAGRAPPWRDLHRRLKAAKTEEEAIEAIGALRELLMIEGLLDSSSSMIG